MLLGEWSYPPYMEVDMGLSKKTTILLSEDLHRRLIQLAEQRQTSLGDLVREACVHQYGLIGKEERVDAVRRLSELSLPVADSLAMKRESVPDPEDLLS